MGNKKLYFLTTNEEKLGIARNAINLYNSDIELIPEKIDYHEIQAENSELIALDVIKKVKNEYQGKNIVKSDSGLYIPALNGFPGQYSKYVENTLTAENILNLMNGVGNREAYYKEVLCFLCDGKYPMLFTGITKGVISYIAEGNHGQVFDKVFIPEHGDRTIANYELKEKVKMYDTSHWKQLFKEL